MQRSAVGRWGMASVALLALMLVWLVAVQAQEAAPPRITLSLQDKDVGEVLTQIAQQGKVKIISDSTVTGKVNLDAKDATVEAALQGICDTLKVEWRRLVVTPGSLATMDADQVSRMIRALESASQMGLLVQNAKAKQAIATEPQKELAAVPAGKEAVYLLFDPTRQPGAFRGNRAGNVGGPGGFAGFGAGGAGAAGGAGGGQGIFSPEQISRLRGQFQNLRDNRDPAAWEQFRAGLAGMFPQLTREQQQQVISEGMWHYVFREIGGGFRGRRGGPGG